MQDNLSPKTVRVLLAHGDDVVCLVTRDEARDMREGGTHYFVNHGRDLRTVKAEDPRKKSALRMLLGWKPKPNIRSSAVLEGKAYCTKDKDGNLHVNGHVRYPVPYAWEGHLREPQAMIINGGDR